MIYVFVYLLFAALYGTATYALCALFIPSDATVAAVSAAINIFVFTATCHNFSSGD